jgi:hypothetical protein
MSHVLTIETEVRDAAAVQAACARLGLPRPAHGTVQLFSGQATGLAVQLSGWIYPVVCQLETGQLKFDNYGGRWGERAQLDHFLQAYAIEMAKLEARRAGHQATETQLADGYVEVTVQLGEAA